MQVGTVVKYTKKYPDGMEMDWIGIVIDCEIDGDGVVPHVQWSNGMRQWRYDVRFGRLEVICK